MFKLIKILFSLKCHLLNLKLRWIIFWKRPFIIEKESFIVLLFLTSIVFVSLGQLWRAHQVEPVLRADIEYLERCLDDNKSKLKAMREKIGRMETSIGLLQGKGKKRGWR